MRDAIRNKVTECIAQANEAYGVSIKVPEVRFDLRGHTAGQACFPRGSKPYIRINRDLLHDDRMLSRTAPHEVAHVVARHVFGRGIRPHGQEWAAVMRLFGCEPSRCHSYETTSVRREFDYACGCQQVKFTSIRHNRNQRALRERSSAAYRCTRCGTDFVQVKK